MSDIEAPASPQNTLALRSAKIAVFILSALIILALIGLVVGAILKLSGRSTHVLGESETAFVLPPGAKILTSETQAGRLILHVRSSQGEEIDIISTENGKLVGQVKTAPPPPPVRQ